MNPIDMKTLREDLDKLRAEFDEFRKLTIQRQHADVETIISLKREIAALRQGG